MIWLMPLQPALNPFLHASRHTYILSNCGWKIKGSNIASLFTHLLCNEVTKSDLTLRDGLSRLQCIGIYCVQTKTTNAMPPSDVALSPLATDNANDGKKNSQEHWGFRLFSLSVVMVTFRCKNKKSKLTNWSTVAWLSACYSLSHLWMCHIDLHMPHYLKL